MPDGPRHIYREVVVPSLPLDTAGKGGREVTVACLHIDLRLQILYHRSRKSNVLLQAPYAD